MKKCPQNFEIWIPDLDFFQGLKMERRPPQQFSTIFGDVPDPHSHSEHQKKKFGEAPEFFEKGTQKSRFFAF